MSNYRPLTAMAESQGISVKELVKGALVKGGNPHAAALLLGVSRTSILHVMRTHGLVLRQVTVVDEIDSNGTGQGE